MRKPKTRSRKSKVSDKYGIEYKRFAKKQSIIFISKKKMGKESSRRLYLSLLSGKKDLDSKVKWFEKALTVWLDKYAKVTKVIAYSKRW